MINRVFLIILDSFGIGNAPDAALFGDEGSNTLRSVADSKAFDCPILQKLGLFNIDGADFDESRKVARPLGSYAALSEKSMGKDTSIGHWEIAGVISPKPMPTYPNGFPKEIIAEFERLTGRKTLCNLPYSGTQVIKDYGIRSVSEGALIVYTSADSVFQIAAHEDVVPPEQLYRYCRIARGILTGENAVGRVIARPFAGEYPFYRTPRRHDFSVEPPSETMLDVLKSAGCDVIAVGKIGDIFAGRGVTESFVTVNNEDGMDKTLAKQKRDFRGLCFVNLVDFDMNYGHRNDADGYAAALTAFDKRLSEFIGEMRHDDVLIISADHGCDPGTPSTDHSRERVPMIIYGNEIKNGVNLGVRDTYADICATVLDMLGADKATCAGKSFFDEVKK
ncbi:MAG: phosphopentomutase [Candidatus Neoclostridium sp.]